VPQAQLVANAVCALEILGGLLLIAGTAVRPVAVLLAANMIGAIVTLSGPGAFGKPVHIREWELGAEPWRLPVEVAMLVAMVWLAARKRPQGSAPRR
jgi:uncharacterized membrane protein YphA (DoxX/SURF4 family)